MSKGIVVPTNKVDYKMDLLWTNAAPSSGFAAQTVNLDLTLYDYVIIGVAFSGTSGTTCYPCPKGKTVRLVSFWNDAQDTFLLRDATVGDTGVVFGDGKHSHVSGTDNAWCVPQYIYGIKRKGG